MKDSIVKGRTLLSADFKEVQLSWCLCQFSYFSFMELDLFIESYKIYAGMNRPRAFIAIVIGNTVNMYRNHYLEMGITKDIEKFETALTNLKLHFDLEEELVKMKGSMICIKFENDTLMFQIYGGNEICGNLIGIIENVSSVRFIDSIQRTTICSFGIRFRCQYGEMDIAFGDFSAIDNF
jgi:hypothetical protein